MARASNIHVMYWSYTLAQEEFVEHTDEFKNQKDFQKKADLKDQSFYCYMAYLLLYNIDQAKYRSLLTGLRSQYSLGNISIQNHYTNRLEVTVLFGKDQYPKSVNSATDILSNHRHDNQNEQHGSSEYTVRHENSNDKD